MTTKRFASIFVFAYLAVIAATLIGLQPPTEKPAPAVHAEVAPKAQWPWTPPFPAPDPDPTSEIRCEVMNSGPIPYGARKITWTNTTGQTLLVRYVRMWCGVSYGGIADVDAQLTVRNTMLLHYQEDHYAMRNAPIDVRENFTVDENILINPGDVLTLQYGVGTVQPPAKQVQFVVCLGAQYVNQSPLPGP